MSGPAENVEPAGLDPAAKAELDRAFEELYRDHLKDVYSYAYYRVGNPHDAEDLTEQTFLQAYRHFDRARRESDGRPLRPWLIRIAHNLASNYYRDRSRRPQTFLDPVERTPYWVYFVGLIFTGLGSPYWDPYARGTVVGITRGSKIGRAHV